MVIMDGVLSPSAETIEISIENHLLSWTNHRKFNGWEGMIWVKFIAKPNGSQEITSGRSPEDQEPTDFILSNISYWFLVLDDWSAGFA